MTLSTRVSIQWGSENPSENTDTLVFTTKKEHFVDVRILKSEYPHIQEGLEPREFEEIFDWIIIGDEEPIAGTNKIQFNHTVNLQEILRSLKSGLPLLECKNAPDVGDFSAIEGSEDRKETGSMVNPSTGLVTLYVELWRSLNPNKTTFAEEVREGRDKNGGKDTSDDELINFTFDLNDGPRYGRIIALGNWVQGVIYDSSEKTHPLSVVRAFYNCEAKEWVTLIKYGVHEFPDPSAVISSKVSLPWRKIE